MNLKSVFQKLLLRFINLLYYPNVLGYWSENNTGGFCITNKECTKLRWLGHENWNEWDNNPGYLRVYNEYLEVASYKIIDLKTLLYIIKEDSNVQSRALFVYTFLWLETIELTIRLSSAAFGWPVPEPNPYTVHLLSTIFITSSVVLGNHIIKTFRKARRKANAE